MKNNTFFKLFIILLAALLLRLWFIDKPEGLWNDEYVGWYIASKKDIGSFFSEMLKNCHTPLYYLYLKFWMLLFPDTDLSLRYSSVVPSIISIVIMFFTGKELKDKKLGLLAAFFTAISSFHIYFAQEVRLYSLLFLFTSLCILYFIKVLKNPNNKNFLLYFISNALIISVHTLGIIFSFFNILFLIIYLYKYSEKYKDKIESFISVIKYIMPFIITLIIICPILINITFSKSLSQFWAGFSFSKIIFNFIDYFSPVQTNIINCPDSLTSYIYVDNNVNWNFLLFAIIPLLIGIYAIYNAVKQKDNILNFLLLSSLLFFISTILISMTGKMILITKYTSEIYSSLILAVSYGFISIKKDIVKKLIIGIFIFLNLFYIYYANDSAPKRTRPEGNLAVVKLIENSRLKNNDIILLTYYDIDKFERYLKDKNKYRFYSINKFNFNYFMFNNDNYYDVINNGKYLYKEYFEIFPNPIIKKYTLDYFNSKTKKGDRIGIIFLDTVSFLSNDNIKEILDDDYIYSKTPFIFLAFSALKNNLLISLKNDYKIDSITQSGVWTLFVFERNN